MKNLIIISFLFFVFSCGNNAQTENDSAKTTSQPIETEQNQTKTAVENSSNANIEETKVLAKNDIKEEIKPEKAIATNPTKNNSSKAPSTSKPKSNNPSTSSTVNNETEAKAQIEAEKAKALAEKMRLEEEMKKAEVAKKAKGAAEAKAKKEMEEKANSTTQKGEISGSNEKKPTADVGLHDELDALLKKYVSSKGKVNYAGLKKEESKLNVYLKNLENTDVKNSWSRNEALAFWINAYNAYTIKLILKNYPVKSIMDLNNGKPWDIKWIKIDQRTLSLNNIENDIIRPKYNEPRIHFAVNCAAKSCPPLLNKAWTARNLNSNLERQTKSFINNSNYNTIASGNAEVSKIFDWYGKDFGDLKTYLNKYSDTKIAAGTSINFKTYNWELNN